MAEGKEICGTSGKINVIAEHKDYPSPGTSKAEEPKLIQEYSWTKTVPYKHWHSYVKPTDNIGSIFTPDVHAYRTRILTKRGVKPARWHPFGADGVLTNPPRFFIERHNEEVKRKFAAMAEKGRDFLPENIISLKDLADDTWLRKKSRDARILMKKESIRKRRIIKRKPDRKVTRDVFVKLINESLTKVKVKIFFLFKNV